MAFPNRQLGVFESAGVPSAGTDEVQTLTIGGTPTGGSFRLSYNGVATGQVAWSATNATLIANVLAALVALPGIGAGGITVAAGALTAGIGTIALTYAGNNARKAVQTIQVVDNSMTGTSPTVAVVETTPGVDATLRGVPKGAIVSDTTNAKLYINTGSVTAPTWAVVGTQS